MNRPLTSKQVQSMPIGYNQTAIGNRKSHRRRLQSISPIYGYQLNYVQVIGNKHIKHAVYRKK